MNATVSLVRYYGAVVCMKKRDPPQDPDCTLALQHVPDLLTWAILPDPNIPSVNASEYMWNTRTTDPGIICEHNLKEPGYV